MSQPARANEPTASATGLTVSLLADAPFGAEIRGLDPMHITDRETALIWDTYKARHGLLCFSFDRLLEAEELHALTAVFGANEFAPGKINGIGKRTPEGEEQVTVEAQVAALRSRGEDPYMSYIEVPPTFSLLHSRVIPPQGGDTGFCSQVMAAQELPAPLRRRLVQLRAKHDSTYGSSGTLRPGMTVPASPMDATGHTHPILRTVPTTGEEAIFLGRRTNGYVAGLPLPESEQLLDELWAHATQEQFCYRHQWQVGQVVVWDNRMLLHMRYPMANDQARFMWRTQTQGERVIPAPLG
jgi:taurine dioxygenase